MKREILCMDCTSLLDLGSYPGEGWKTVLGNVVGDVCCDHCATDLPQGTAACALSIFTTDGRMPYYPWETDYLAVKEGE